MNNGKTQPGVSRKQQANRLQICRMSRTGVCSTVKCPQLMALARGKTTHFTFDGQSNTETDVRETATKSACDGFVWGSHKAGSEQATAHLQRTGIDRNITTSQTPKIIFHTPKVLKRKENKEGAGRVQRLRLYCQMPNKSPKIIRRVFGVLREISEFDLGIQIFLNEPLTTSRHTQVGKH